MAIYLDCNATTPVAPEVMEVMLPYFQDRLGNSASPHAFGRVANSAVSDAQRQLGGALNTPPNSIVWTSGATEAINTILKGISLRESSTRRNIICSSVEHKAVLDTLNWLHNQGHIERGVAPVSATGEVDYAKLEALTDDGTLAVCVMAANNETGVINDVSRIATIAHKCGATFVCDATQQVGKITLDLIALAVDAAAVSAHKVYGPQGVGAMIVNSPHLRDQIVPLVHGGGHQGGLRAGTLNVPGIVGFGAASELAANMLVHEQDRLDKMRNRLECLLHERAGPITIHGLKAQRLPNTTNIRVHGVDADALMAHCPDIAMSSGSACTSAVPAPSHVLTAMGVPPHEAEESVRLSLGRFTTEADIEKAAELIGAAAARIRQMNA